LNLWERKDIEIREAKLGEVGDSNVQLTSEAKSEDITAPNG
jgi:hypothetical protein